MAKSMAEQLAEAQAAVAALTARTAADALANAPAATTAVPFTPKTPAEVDALTDKQKVAYFVAENAHLRTAKAEPALGALSWKLNDKPTVDPKTKETKDPTFSVTLRAAGRKFPIFSLSPTTAKALLDALAVPSDHPFRLYVESPAIAITAAANYAARWSD